MASPTIAATATSIATICGHAGIICNSILFRALNIHRVLVSLRFEIVAIQVSLQLIEELLVEDEKLAESVQKIEIWNRSFDTVLQACGLTLTFVIKKLQELFHASDGLLESLLDAESIANWVNELQGQRGVLRILVETLRSKLDMDVEQVLEKEQDTFAKVDASARQLSQEVRPWIHQVKFVHQMLELRLEEQSLSTSSGIIEPSPYQIAEKAQHDTPTDPARGYLDNDDIWASNANTNISDRAHVYAEREAESDDTLTLGQNVSSHLGALRELDRSTRYGRESPQKPDASFHFQPTDTQGFTLGSTKSVDPAIGGSQRKSLLQDLDATKTTTRSREVSEAYYGSHRYKDTDRRELQAGSSESELAITLMPRSFPDPWIHYSPEIGQARIASIQKTAPLHFAAFTGRIETMRELLYGPMKQRIDPNAQFEKDTPIIYAIRSGHTAAVEVLLAAGANPSIRCAGEMTSHHWAVICSRKEIYRLLCQLSVPSHSIAIHGQIDYQTYKFDGWDLLSLAAYFSNIDLVQTVRPGDRILLELFSVTGCEWKVLHAAVASLPYLALTWVISNRNASESWRKMQYDPFWLCKSSLVSNLPRRLWCEDEIEACKMGTLSDRLPFITSVLAKTIDIERKDPFGYTALQAACCGTSTEIVEKLLLRAKAHWRYVHPGSVPHNKAKKSALRPSSTSRPTTPRNYALDVSPLHLAAFWGRHDIIKVLVREGADPNVSAYGGSRPLHFAAAMGNTKAVQVLLSLNADADVGSCSGYSCIHRQCEEVKQTPLSLALEGNHLEAMRALIQGGADVKKQIYDADPVTLGILFKKESKENILCRAIRKKSSTRAIEVLLDHGAYTKSLVGNIDPPLHLAIKNHCSFQTIKLLLSHGSDPNLLDQHKQPALNLAIDIGSKTGEIRTVIKVLLDAGANPRLSCLRGYTAIMRCTHVINMIQGDRMKDADWLRMHPIKDYIAVAQMLQDK